MGRAECFNAHAHRQTSVNRRKTSHCHDHRLVCVAVTRQLVTSEFRSWRTTSTSTGRVCGWNIIAVYVGNARMLKWRMAVRSASRKGSERAHLCSWMASREGMKPLTYRTVVTYIRNVLRSGAKYHPHEPTGHPWTHGDRPIHSVMDTMN